MRDESNDRKKLAQEIRTLFQREKREQLKKPYRPHPSHDTDEVWEKAALKCMELDADPYSFVRSAFEFCLINAKNSKGPFPKHLGSGAMNRWYANYAGDKDTGETCVEENLSPFESQVRSDINTLSQMAYSAFMYRGVPIEDTLCMEITPAPAYARFFLMPDAFMVRHKYRKQVLYQVSRNPSLGKALERLGLNMDKLYE